MIYHSKGEVMKKHFSGSLLFLVTVTVVISFFVLLFLTVENTKEAVIEGFTKAEKPYLELVNKKIVVEKDTLTVTDYSIISDKIILSNGKEVSLKYAQLNKVEDNGK